MKKYVIFKKFRSNNYNCILIFTFMYKLKENKLMNRKINRNKFSSSIYSINTQSQEILLIFYNNLFNYKNNLKY